MILSEFLTAQSLDLLSIIWTRGSEKLQHVVASRIQNYCKIDLVKEWEHLTDDQLKRLHTFEDDNQPWLLLQLFNDQDADGGTAETKYVTTNNRSATGLFWFGIVLTTVSLVYICAITWIPIPPDNQRFADTALGFLLGSVLGTVIQFFFGSSMQKTDFHSYTDSRYRNYPQRSAPCIPTGSPTTPNDSTDMPQVGDVYTPPCTPPSSRTSNRTTSPIRASTYATAGDEMSDLPPPDDTRFTPPPRF